MCFRVVPLVSLTFLGLGVHTSGYFPASRSPLLSRPSGASRWVCTRFTGASAVSFDSAFFLSFVAIFTLSGRFPLCPTCCQPTGAFSLTSGPLACFRSPLTSVSLVSSARVFSWTSCSMSCQGSHTGPCWGPSAGGSFPRSCPGLGACALLRCWCASRLAGRWAARSP